LTDKVQLIKRYHYNLTEDEVNQCSLISGVREVKGISGIYSLLFSKDGSVTTSEKSCSCNCCLLGEGLCIGKLWRGKQNSSPFTSGTGDEELEEREIVEGVGADLLIAEVDSWVAVADPGSDQGYWVVLVTQGAQLARDMEVSRGRPPLVNGSKHSSRGMMLFKGTYTKVPLEGLGQEGCPYQESEEILFDETKVILVNVKVSLEIRSGGGEVGPRKSQRTTNAGLTSRRHLVINEADHVEITSLLQEVDEEELDYDSIT
jgi:hypothetical protein